MDASITPRKVAIVIGSQRTVRAGPQIAQFVLNTIKLYIASGTETKSTSATQIDFELVDIADCGLPLFDEPGVPSQIHNPADYQHEHTRAWSRRISPFDGFVFVTPQYNWGIPAGLKNALDYLFNEWKNKPAMIVSYGSHGGVKCAAALDAVLHCLRMRVAEKYVALSFPDRDFLVTASQGHNLGLDAAAEKGSWADQKPEILQVWQDFARMLEEL